MPCKTLYTGLTVSREESEERPVSCALVSSGWLPPTPPLLRPRFSTPTEWVLAIHSVCAGQKQGACADISPVAA
jgi:hypothetical protein